MENQSGQKAMSKPPTFSIIVPTRGRPEALRRLLESFKETTKNIEAIEVVLVIDEDDGSAIHFESTGVPFKCVIVPPGLNMGALNMAGYEVSRGRYIMLLNDDVIIRTPNWDEKVHAAFRSFSDEIILVHVNDRIFQDKLCTFPFLTRTFCEVVEGICPRDYVRYRIDDHIYNIFNLLSVLGKTRILYLQDVVFEHTNFVVSGTGKVEYQPNEPIHAVDTKRFDDLLPARKELAIRLAGFIDQHLHSEVASLRRKLLDPMTDAVALRLPEYVRISPDIQNLSSENTRVTIGIVSADLRSDHARICIDRVKEFTRNFDLLLLDNNRGPNFNHPCEMNRIISICKSDFLVLMDDDVFVEPGWLDGMLRCMDPSVGVVTPLHKDSNGNLSYAGVVMWPDYSGHHTHCFAVPERPSPLQTLCSAIMLIDVGKCGHLRFDESYSKYFLDIDYGLRVWESGFSVVCSPYTMVTHVGGATLLQGTSISNVLFERQRQTFVRTFIQTKRYQKIERDLWRKIPAIQAILEVPSELDSLLIRNPAESLDGFRRRAHAYFERLKHYPALLDYSRQRIWDSIGEKRPNVDDPELGHLGILLGFCDHPVLIEQNFHGLGIVLWNCNYYAIPRSEGGFYVDQVARQGYSCCYQAATIDLLKAQVVADHGRQAESVKWSVLGLSQTKLVRGFHIVAKGLQLLREDRTRYGSWKPAIYMTTKSTLKNLIISLWGFEAFDRLKTEWRAMSIRNPNRSLLLLGPQVLLMVLCKGGRPMIRRTGHHSQLKDETLRVSKGTTMSEGDAQKWLDVSPLTLVELPYCGYSIYRFEYKFFAVPESVGSFDFEAFKRGEYGQSFVGHSLPEVHAAIDRLDEKPNCARGGRGLFLACLSPAQLRPIIDSAGSIGAITLLVGRDQREAWRDFDCIVVERDTVYDWIRLCKSSVMNEVDRRIADGKFDRIIMPWNYPETWATNLLEDFASKLSQRLDVVHSSGVWRTYEGENLHRLVYNKAYLVSLFQSVGWPEGKSVLEVGCSDGLVCDIFALSGAEKVVGIDMMKTVGCSFPNKKIEYQVRDAESTGFRDQSFDLVYSIATLEHVRDPYRVLLEIFRVTKVGGYAYVQAGPLYHSPFGHHMFAYFKNYPWIHLRKSKEEIKAYAREHEIDKTIKRDLGVDCEEYIDGMLNDDHVNGLFLEGYRLTEFRNRQDIKVLKFNISYEGRELLTPEILGELSSFKPDCLLEHGFEIVFQRQK